MTDFIKRLCAICKSEWLHFGKQSINVDNRLFRSGNRETDPGFWQRVGVYWEVGTNLDLDGLDVDWPWSAAFMSYVMKMAGAEDHFKYSIRHSDYINDAILNANPSFVGRRVSEYAPKIGDIVCYSRQNGVDFDNLPDRYRSHGDVVCGIKNGYIEVIGGNVINSVTKKNLRVDSDGLLSDTNHAWFAIIDTQL